MFNLFFLQTIKLLLLTFTRNKKKSNLIIFEKKKIKHSNFDIKFFLFYRSLGYISKQKN